MYVDGEIPFDNSLISEIIKAVPIEKNPPLPKKENHVVLFRKVIKGYSVTVICSSNSTDEYGLKKAIVNTILRDYKIALKMQTVCVA